MHRHYLECWRVLFFLLFLTPIVYQCNLRNVRPYESLLAFLFSGPFNGNLLSFTSRMVPSILQEGQPRCLSLWWDFCYVVWFQVVFAFSWDTFFYNFFFHLRLFNSVHFQYSQVLVSFLCWFGSSIPCVICCFVQLIISMAHFSMTKSIHIS